MGQRRFLLTFAALKNTDRGRTDPHNRVSHRSRCRQVVKGSFWGDFAGGIEGGGLEIILGDEAAAGKGRFAVISIDIQAVAAGVSRIKIGPIFLRNGSHVFNQDPSILTHFLVLQVLF